MSTSITTRQTAGTGATVKGSPLSNTEVDNNFIGLNQAVQPAGGTAGQILAKIDATNFNSQWVDNYAVQVKLPVKNATGATIPKGAVVYVSGAAGANALISLAQASGDSTSATTVGFLESTLATGDTGLVVVTGVISGIDTSAATEGDPVWLSGTTAGGVLFGVANKPQAPTHIVYLGTVTRAHHTVGEIQVHISNGWEIEELHDVKITSKANNDTLFYNSAQGVWVNAAPAAARSNLGLGALAVESSLKTVNGQSVLGSGNIQIDGGVTSFNTRAGAVTLDSSDVTTALGFTPYNSSNPSGYITSAELSSYLPLSGGTLTGDLGVQTGTILLQNGDPTSFPKGVEFTASSGMRTNIAFGAIDGFNYTGGLYRAVAYDTGSGQQVRKTGYAENALPAKMEFTFGGINLSVGALGAAGSTITWTKTLTLDPENGVRINGNTALHAGNYSSYALPLTGGTLTGSLAGTQATFGNVGISTAANTITSTDTNGSLTLGANGTGNVIVSSTLRLPASVRNSAGSVLFTVSGTTVNYATDLTVQNMRVGLGNNGGSNNTAVGYQTLNSITPGTPNGASGRSTTAVGYTAGYSVTSGSYNTMLGAGTGYLLTTGANNTLVGYNAGTNTTTAADNVLIGASAGTYLTTGQRNVVIGSSARAAATSYEMVAIGTLAGPNNTNANTGSVFVGAGAGTSASSEDAVVIGRAAGQDISGLGAIAIGRDAGSAAMDTAVAIGYGAGRYIGYGSIAIGRDTGGSKNNWSNSTVAIGYAAMGAATNNNSALGSVAVGTNSQQSAYSGNVGSTVINGGGGYVDGTYSFVYLFDNNYFGYFVDLTVIGTALDSVTFLMGGPPPGSELSLDNPNNAGPWNNYGTQGFGGSVTYYESAIETNYNTSVGFYSLKSLNNGNYNTAIGYRAGENLNGIAGGGSASTNNVLVGPYAGANLTGSVQNIAIGSEAMSGSANESNRNVAIGTLALAGTLNFAWDNVAIGEQAGRNATSASSNVFIGSYSGTNIDSGSSNVAVGNGSGASMTSGYANVTAGYNSGYNLTTGASNVFVGTAAGFSVTTGSNNTFIGSYFGGPGQSNAVAIADGAGRLRMLYDASFGGMNIGSTNTTASGAAYVSFPFTGATNKTMRILVESLSVNSGYVGFAIYHNGNPYAPRWLSSTIGYGTTASGNATSSVVNYWGGATTPSVGVANLTSGPTGGIFSGEIIVSWSTTGSALTVRWNGFMYINSGSGGLCSCFGNATMFSNFSSASEFRLYSTAGGTVTLGRSYVTSYGSSLPV